MQERESISQQQFGAQKRILDPSTRPNSAIPAASARTLPANQVAGGGTVLSLQCLAGNAAVTKWLNESAGPTRQGILVQRDDDGTTADASGGESTGMTPDIFSGMFDTDTLAQVVANLSDSDLGAGDLAPGAPQTEGSDNGTPTAQAIRVQALALQRDPPTSTATSTGTGLGGVPTGDPNQTNDAIQVTLKVIKAVSEVKAVNNGLDEVLQKVLIDWEKLKKDPIAVSVSVPISVMIAAGVVGGIESNPGARQTVNPFVFGKDIPIPVPDSVGGGKLPGLSFKILGSGAQANGLVFTLDFGKVLGWAPPPPQQGTAGSSQ